MATFVCRENGFMVSLVIVNTVEDSGRRIRHLFEKI